MPKVKSVKKVVLAYSGGLDTSICIHWLKEKYGCEVIAVTVDVGEDKDLEYVRDKAYSIGAAKAFIFDGQEEFARDFLLPSLKANALYEGQYPLSAALSRPFISKILVQVARQEGAGAVAHGCTGKGNDQVRFDVSVGALAPDLEIIAPVREWPMSREEAIDYAREKEIPVPVGKKSPYSIDQNLWGRSIECGVLEDPWAEPPSDVYLWTKGIDEAPAEPGYVEISFIDGVPVAVDGEQMNLVALISRLNQIGGESGVGRVDQVENRLVGIKSREIYEAPAASLLIQAHRELEKLTQPRETTQFKALIEQKYAEMVYNGLWYSPLKAALDAFIEQTQQGVTGTVRLKLFKGSSQVVGRKSPMSLYDYKLATYDPADTFDHSAAAGFINIWGLPTRVWAAVTDAAGGAGAPEAGKTALEVPGELAGPGKAAAGD